MSINGPLHSEDWLAIGCPSGSQGPIFGRTGYNDPIETPGVYNDCGSGAPTYTVNNSSGAINHDGAVADASGHELGAAHHCDGERIRVHGAHDDRAQPATRR